MAVYLLLIIFVVTIIQKLVHKYAFRNADTGSGKGDILCSCFKIYWNVILPLLKTATVTSLILKGVSCYNEYYCANLYFQDVKIRTLAISLYIFTGPLGIKYILFCAGVIISMIPAFIVFILCQKQIYSGITSGTVKG